MNLTIRFTKFIQTFIQKNEPLLGLKLSKIYSDITVERPDLIEISNKMKLFIKNHIVCF